MFKKLMAGMALCLLSTGGFAADLQIRTAASPSSLPVFTWAGAYAGVSLGTTWSRAEVTGRGYHFRDSTNLQAAGIGGIGGINIGYNMQSAAFVYGVEADFALSNAASKTSLEMGNLTLDSDLAALGSVRVRLGYAVDRALFYATGGLAYGQTKSKLCDDYYYDYGDCANAGYNVTEWKTGYTVGGGMEYALTNKWMAKVEGLYYNLGQTSYADLIGDNDSYFYRESNDGFVTRTGVNYRF